MVKTVLVRHVFKFFILSQVVNDCFSQTETFLFVLIPVSVVEVSFSQTRMVNIIINLLPVVKVNFGQPKLF